MTTRLGRKQAIAVDRSTNSPLLSIERLGRQIQNRWIWQGISFEVWPGDRLAAIGASGTGKSLLLRAIAGLDPVQQGRIVFGGRSLESWYMPLYRSHIVYLHQRPALLEGSVEENLQYIYKLAGHRDQVYNREQILGYLDLLGRTADFLERPSAALSGGEAQIVAFLRALQLSPCILLLDEPTASLDPETAHCLESLVDVWQAEDSTRAYLWTSHNPTQIQRMTNRQIALKGKD